MPRQDQQYHEATCRNITLKSQGLLAQLEEVVRATRSVLNDSIVALSEKRIPAIMSDQIVLILEHVEGARRNLRHSGVTKDAIENTFVLAKIKKA